MQNETNKSPLSECSDKKAKKSRRQPAEVVMVEVLVLHFAIIGAVLYRFFGLRGIIPVFFGTIGFIIEKLFG